MQMFEEKLKLPVQVEKLLSALWERGYEAYIVGGCVRDYLLGIQPKDWDITTSALPEQVKAVFDGKNDGIHTVDTGIKHGTVTVVAEHIGYEVTTYRIDGEYIDNRHPENVTFTDNITGDLARRDFTMNAIAYSPEKGFVDPFGGIDDIKRAIIRGVGVAANRFQEDALRMMRALRFSAQLNFEIESETYNAIIKKADLIKNISIERVRDEFTKLLLTDNPHRIWDLQECGILELFLPQVKLNCEMLENLRNSERILSVRLAIIMYGADDIKGILKKLTFDNRTIKEVVMLDAYRNMPQQPTAYHIRRLLSLIDVNGLELLLALKKAVGAEDYQIVCELFNSIMENGDCYSVKMLAISGEDIKKQGITSGVQIGEILKRALEIVMENPQLNEKETLINLLIKKETVTF